MEFINFGQGSSFALSFAYFRVWLDLGSSNQFYFVSFVWVLSLGRFYYVVGICCCSNADRFESFVFLWKRMCRVCAACVFRLICCRFQICVLCLDGSGSVVFALTWFAVFIVLSHTVKVCFHFRRSSCLKMKDVLDRIGGSS